MTRHIGPRADSAAHKVICRLVDLGGRATSQALMDVLSPEFHSPSRFNMCVVDQLIRFRLVTVVDGYFTATLAGKEFVGEYIGCALVRPKKYVGQVATPRAIPVRPLNLSRLVSAAPVREGAFDYRGHASLMGRTRKLPTGEVVE